MLFEKFVEQHGVDRFVTHGADFAIPAAEHQMGVYLFYVLGDEAELRAARGINFCL